MTQNQGLLHFRTPQVDVAIFQADVFARQVFRGRLERRVGALVEDFDMGDADFNLAGVEFRVYGAFGPVGHFATDQNHEFRSESFGDLQGSIAAFRSEHDLGLAVTVA
jgi:hypothetical protein